MLHECKLLKSISHERSIACFNPKLSNFAFESVEVEHFRQLDSLGDLTNVLALYILSSELMR